MRGKGEGAIFYDEGRGLWTARFELPPDPRTGVRRRKTIRRKDKGDLIDARTKLLVDLDRAGDLPTSSPVLEKWVQIWLDKIAAPRLKPKSLAGYRSYMDQHVVPALGRYRLDQLSPSHIRRMHEAITDQGLSTTTALQAHRILAKCLTDAVREGKVSRNVATLVDAPRKAVTHQQSLTAEQAKIFLKHVANHPHGARWAVAMLTGLRQGEQLGMTREFLDLENEVITVAWALSRVVWEHGCGPRELSGWPCGMARAGSCRHRSAPIPAGTEARQVHGGLWLLRPKSRAGWREVPMPPGLAQILRRHVETHAPADLVFTRDGGKPIDPAKDYHAWIALLDECGLPRVKLHSARHTTATLLYEIGVPENTRMAILGHSSATTTAGYTRIADSLTRDAMQRYGALLSLEN
ncbi:tyrosine-type recombinase/integrase [Oerskovia enterophila]|uniref:Prophage phiRv2 integrase n=1 Tax=Oerskovia enterophila TaxID=43678 RepID=A0ABX2Y1M2_9CELL|nr:site-specific integrase [Oerskovia enterophila]OCI30036.1 putative prophage phiRv2 integrase [Oerskovia enterophila]